MKFVFLYYAQRSGSTFLGRLLAEKVPSLIVLPEFRLVESLIAASQKRDVPVDNIRYLVSLDHQLGNLGLSQERQTCLEELSQINVRDVLTKVADLYQAQHGTRATTCIVKLGPLLYVHNLVREHFPDARFIHIIRDPRAVVNSRLRAYRPYFPSERMGRGDPWFIAKSWCDYIDRVERAETQGSPILTIRYEELIISPSKIQERILYRLIFQIQYHSPESMRIYILIFSFVQEQKL